MRIIKILITGVVCGLILFHTWPLKIISVDSIPKVGETFDEYAVLWSGMSLANGGLPVGWTTNLGAYSPNFPGSSLKGTNLEVQGKTPNWTRIKNVPMPGIAVVEYDYGLGKKQIALVQPYFDHPPLAGLIYTWGAKNDNKSLIDITPDQLRAIPRYVSLVTAGLTGILGYLLYGATGGIAAVALYSTMPSTVFSGRMVLTENVISPLMLLAMIILKLAKSRGNVKLFAGAGLVSGAAMLSKFPGIGVLVAGVVWGVKEKISWKYLIIFLASGLFIGGLYVIYGLWIAPQLFIRVMLAQAGRGLWGTVNLWEAVGRLWFLDFPIDGWWIGGWLVLIYLGTKAAHFLPVIFAATYILSVTLFGGGNSAWYFFPLGAVFCLLWAGLINEIRLKPNWINLGLLFFFGFSSSWYWGYAQYHTAGNPTNIIRIGALVLVMLKIIGERWGNKFNWSTLIWPILLVIILHRMYVWNFRGIQYLLTNWSRLPYPSAFSKQ